MDKQPTSEDIFKEAVDRYQQLLKSNMDEDLLNSSAIGIIEKCPAGMHDSLMLKFTYMLGYNKGLTTQQIYDILQKS